MRERIVGLLGGKRRRLVLATVVSVAALGAVLVTTALAVHDEQFQLDGNVATSPDGTVGGGTQPYDWQDFFNAAGSEITPLPAGFDASVFNKDFRTNANGSFNTSDGSTFATGSKDTLAITPGWQCNVDANVNSKIDIMNSYATSYTNAAGQKFLYFALERNANTGTADVGFWFLQDDNVNCSSPGGNTAFSGDHVDGDLLVVSEFTSGGSVSNINVYRWDGGANGSLNPTPVISNPVSGGADCRTTPVTGTQDRACGIANTANISAPWQTSNKQDGPGNTLRTAEFFEGGVNLTEAGLSGKCFNSFLADTRSSTSLTATLFDFSAGELGQCTSTTKTTPSISSAPIPVHNTLSVTDSAKVDVTGAPSSFTGNVKFFLCRQSELNASGECATGGTQIGGSKSVTASGQTVVSDAAGLTAADHYCWRAEFSGDASVGVPGSSDHSTSECFDVTPRTPTLTTDATDGPVDFGQKISDTISLTGTADKPGTNGSGPGGTIDATNRAAANGTISVTAFGPDDCTTTAHSATINVSGDNTAYGGAGSSTEFTPSAPGKYTYVASYSGDSPNTLSKAATACPDPTGTEEVVVRTIPTTIQTKQSWFPNDTATVASTIGNLGSGGSVVFSLYATADCSGAVKYTETKSISGGSPSQEVSTSNGPGASGAFAITTGYNDPADSATGKYSWKVVYTPGASDTAHTGKQSSCDAEHFNTTYTNDKGPGSDLP